MTDRQEIIINGVDVSGCDNSRDGYCCPGTGVSYKCDTNCQYACCVYKERLQRKTAECEELKEWCDTKDCLYQKMTDNFTTSYIEAKRYKQALDEIEDTDLEHARCMIRVFNHYTERGKHRWDRKRVPNKQQWKRILGGKTR